MVVVFIWLPKLGSGDIGHGSMAFKYGYVSNWPGTWRSIAYGLGHANQTFEDDRSAEHGRYPEVIYRIEGLDEGAMRDEWLEMKKDLKYSFATYNCFTTVAEVLDAGCSWWQVRPIPSEVVIAHAILINYMVQLKVWADVKRLAPASYL